MRTIYAVLFFVFFISLHGFCQTDGLTYQAIIMNPDSDGFNGELPGVDVSSELLGEGNILSLKDVQIRFTIIRGTGTVEYQEMHSTTTDKYGLINLVIGQGSPIFGNFTQINWNAEPRNLKVELNYGSFGFLELSNQPLYFIPYAYHRNITATGTLDVDLATNLNDSLSVNNQSPTYLSGTLDVDLVANLNDSLSVNNQAPTYLSGTLDVDLATNLKDSLSVNNQAPTYLSGTLDVDLATNLKDSLYVNNQAPTYLSGTLDVDFATNLNDSLSVNNQTPTYLSGTLDVDLATNLMDSLYVNNQAPTYLSGTLDVDFATNLNDSLSVNNQAPTYLSGTLVVDLATHMNDSLSVYNQAPTYLSGTLDVDLATNLNDSLSVNNQAPTYLSGTLNVDGATVISNTADIYGQVSINSAVPGTEDEYSAYPLRVEGSDQGIAIKVNAATPNNSNNFITFFDNFENAVGRIEGQTAGEVASSPEYIYENSILIAEEVKNGVNVGLSALPTCVGGLIISCGVSASSIAMAAADLVLSTANLAAYNVFAFSNLGVTYESGSADYAEWLERINPFEQIYPGEIVGVIAGKISKLEGANQFMVISTKPSVLGNMPDKSQTHLYNKVAFMGQVPVKVRGIVFYGDFIIPSGKNDGVGVAVSPENLSYKDYNKVVGIAWSHLFGNENQVTMINMAVGLNSFSIADLISKQEKQIVELESRLISLEERLLAIETSKKREIEVKNDSSESNSGLVAKCPSSNKILPSRYENIIENMPSELSDEVIEDAFDYLLNVYEKQGIKISDHKGLDKLFNDPIYKAEVISKTKENYKLNYQAILQKAMQ